MRTSRRRAGPASSGGGATGATGVTEPAGAPARGASTTRSIQASAPPWPSSRWARFTSDGGSGNRASSRKRQAQAVSCRQAAAAGVADNWNSAGTRRCMAADRSGRWSPGPKGPRVSAVPSLNSISTPSTPLAAVAPDSQGCGPASHAASVASGAAALNWSSPAFARSRRRQPGPACHRPGPGPGANSARPAGSTCKTGRPSRSAGSPQPSSNRATPYSAHNARAWRTSSGRAGARRARPAGPGCNCCSGPCAARARRWRNVSQGVAGSRRPNKKARRDGCIYNSFFVARTIMLRLASRARDFLTFQVVELFKEAQALQAAGRDIISLGIGEPDFTAPAHAVEALARHVRAGLSCYSAPAGLSGLREAIAGFYASEFGATVDPSRVIVTAGASGALSLACAALVDAGAEVLMPDPSYPANSNFILAAGGRPRLIPGSAETRFQLSAQQVRDHWTDATRGVLVASPSNPTGTSIARDELAALLHAVRERQGFAIVDEIYLGLSYEHAPRSALTL